MELKVKDLYDFVRFIMNKTINGALSPDNFNLIANIASKSYFDFLISGLNVYMPGSKTAPSIVDSKQSINGLLQPFLETDRLTVALGLTTLPADSRKTIKLFLDDGVETEVIWKRDFELSVLFKSFIDEIELTNPVYKEMPNRGLKIYPDTITSVDINYYTYPKECKWNYTQSGSKPVYSSVGSIDMGWTQEALIPVSSRILSSVGINLKDGELVQYAQIIKQQ
jgi:hypothetical protein